MQRRGGSSALYRWPLRRVSCTFALLCCVLTHLCVAASSGELIAELESLVDQFNQCGEDKEALAEVKPRVQVPSFWRAVAVLMGANGAGSGLCFVVLGLTGRAH